MNMLRTILKWFCICLVSSALLPLFGESKNQKNFYLMGYSYGGILLNLHAADKYTEQKIAYFKVIFNTEIFAKILDSKIDSEAIGDIFAPEDLQNMKINLGPLTRLIETPMPLTKIKARFSYFDKIISKYLDRGDEFSYFMTLGLYANLLTYFRQPPAITEGMIVVWEKFLLLNAEKYLLPDQFQKLCQELISLQKKLVRAELSDAENQEIHSRIRRKATQIHDLFRDQDLSLMSI